MRGIKKTQSSVTEIPRIVKNRNPIVKKNFTKVPNKIIESDVLKPTDKLILIYVLSFEVCFASLETIAKKLGYSRSTVQRAMRRLEYMGCIEKQKAAGHSQYYVAIPIDRWVSQRDDSGSHRHALS